MLATLLATAALTLPALTPETTLSLCGQCAQGWQMQDLQGMQVRQASLGAPNLVLAPQISANSSPILRLFDTQPRVTGPILENTAVIAPLAHGAQPAGLFQGQRRIRMQTTGDSWFSRMAGLGSFTISASVKLSRYQADAVLLSSVSSTPVGGRILESGLELRFDNGQAVIELVNLAEGQASIRLRSSRSVALNRWSYVVARFDAVTHELLLAVDGRVVAQTFLTDDGNAAGAPLVLGFPASPGREIIVGEGMIGAISQLQVISDAGPLMMPPAFGPGEARFMSQIIDLGSASSAPIQILTEGSLPDGTLLSLEARLSSGPLTVDSPESLAAWQPVSPDGRWNGNPASGRYLQIRGRLTIFGHLESSPAIESIEIRLRQGSLPRPPQNLRVVASADAPTLRWHGTLQSNIVAYRIYYGNRSRVYIEPGEIITVPVSALPDRVRPEFVLPVDRLGRQVIYLSLTAVDASGQESDLSNEVVVALP